MNKKYNIGYTTGVFDLFHIGHLNILSKAKKYCNTLIVGVTTDEEVEKIKNKKTVIPYEERIQIVESIKYVDIAVAEHNTDKLKAWHMLRFDVIFKGDDWKGSEKWEKYEKEFSNLGVEVVYFPYTKGTSSTMLTETLNVINFKN